MDSAECLAASNTILPSNTWSRTLAVASRNATLSRHAFYRWTLLSGLAEPLLYLGAIGVGVGRLVGDLTIDGRTVPYVAFVAPAMLATSAMSAAIAETAFRLFAKLKFDNLYEAVLATPVNPFEIVLGELLWALARTMIYCLGFIGIMVGFGLTGARGALLAVPATLLVGFAFGGVGAAVATFFRGWQDFDYLNLILFLMFLFSGTFGPVTAFPLPVRIVVEGLPFYHAVALVRACTTGPATVGLLGSIAYLVVVAVLGLAVARHRMNRHLLV
jgi:lipooligosaccharide transport system permease protein